MSKKSILRSVLIAIISIASVLSLSGVANASATVTRFTFFFTEETFGDTPAECMPVVKSGVTHATDTGSGQITETDNGFAVHGSDTFVYRTDFTDGSYVAGVAHGHFSTIVSGSTTVQNDVVREPRTIYSADGTAIGSLMIHFLAHTTTDNLTGETTASIEKFFVTCF
jgi:hypothetical protein